MNIIAYINEQIIDENSVNPSLYQVYKYLDDFQNKYQLDNLNLVAAKDTALWLEVNLIIIAPEYFNEIRNLISKYRRFIKKMNVDYLTALLSTLASEHFRAFAKSLTIKNVVKKTTDFEDVCLKEDIDYFYASKGYGKTIFRASFISDFTKFFEKAGITVKQMKAIGKVIIQINNASLKYIQNDYHDVDGVKRKLTVRENKDNPMRRILFSLFKEIDEIKTRYIREVNTAKRYNHYLKEIINLLINNPDYIPANVISKISSFPVKTDVINTVLDYIAEINGPKEQEALQKQVQMQSDAEALLQNILNEFGINKKKLSIKDKEMLDSISLNDLKIILEFLSKYHIPLSSISELALFDAGKIKTIQAYLDKGLLSPFFIKKHISLVYEDSSLFDTMIANINLLLEYDLNLLNYQDYLDILLSPLAQNAHILDLFKKMGLKIDSGTQDISFLKDSTLSLKVYMLIDNNLLSSLRGFDILNLPYEELYFKVLCHRLNITYDKNLLKEFDISSLMTNPNSLIPEDILAILNNGSANMTFLPPELQAYEISPGILNISGNLVCAYRVMQNLGALYSCKSEYNLFYAIIFNSMYDFAQVEAISVQLASNGIPVPPKSISR